MLSKKILISLLTIGILATVVSAGTWAYYSSSVSGGNMKVTTGTVTLSLENGNFDSGDIDDVTFVKDGAMPGDTDIWVKRLEAINHGNVKGMLTCTAANIRDAQNLGQYLTIKVRGTPIYSHGAPIEVTITDLAPNRYIMSDVTYTFDETNSDQTQAMGGSFICDLKFTLKSIPS
jgi:predicted ribosomally synthesized peptide with SipW-like signal peptide